MLAGSETTSKVEPRAVVLCVIERYAVVVSYLGLGWPRLGVAGRQDRVTRDSIISVIIVDTFGMRYYRLIICVYARK